MVIDAFDDKPSGGLSVIDAGIIVSRDSQKAILIGRAGVKLKELGTLAREKLEQVRILPTVYYESLLFITLETELATLYLMNTVPWS